MNEGSEMIESKDFENLKKENSGYRRKFLLGAAGVATLPVIATTNAASPSSSNAVAKVLSADMFQQEGIGAVVRPMLDKARERFSAADFGIIGDGTNESAKLITALTALSVRGGGTITFAAKTYVFGGIIQNFANNITLQGDAASSYGAGGTKFRASATNVTMFTTRNVSGCWFKDITFISPSTASPPTQTMGAYLRFEGGAACGTENVFMTGAWDGIQMASFVPAVGAPIECGIMWHNCLQIRDFNHDGVFIDGGNDHFFTNVTMDMASAAYTPNAGFHVPNHSGGLSISKADIIHCHTGLLIDPKDGQFVIWMYLDTVFFDSMDYNTARLGRGIRIIPSAGPATPPTGSTTPAKVYGILFSQVWSATGEIGVEISGDGLADISGIHFQQFQCVNNRKNAVYIKAARDVAFTDSLIRGNSTIGNNLHSAVLLDTLADGISFRGGFIGGSQQGLVTVHKYQIEFALGFNGVVIADGVDLRGAGTTAVGGPGQSNAAIGSVIQNCRGYNPLGTTLWPVTASPFTYTASLARETAYLYGGTGVVARINGVAVTTTSPATIQLAPRQQVVITYLTTPTLAINAT
jgi:hypothetical protein